MLITKNKPFIGRRRPDPVPTQAGFQLVQATYIANTSVTLVFNEPIDISEIVPDMISVADGPGETLLIGMGGPTLVNPTTLLLDLESFDPYEGSGTLLTASGGAGIKSATGEVWEGVSGLSLPFEE